MIFHFVITTPPQREKGAQAGQMISAALIGVAKVKVKVTKQKWKQVKKLFVFLLKSESENQIKTIGWWFSTLQSQLLLKERSAQGGQIIAISLIGVSYAKVKVTKQNWKNVFFLSKNESENQLKTIGWWFSTLQSQLLLKERSAQGGQIPSAQRSKSHRQSRQILAKYKYRYRYKYN